MYFTKKHEHNLLTSTKIIRIKKYRFLRNILFVLCFTDSQRKRPSWLLRTCVHHSAPTGDKDLLSENIIRLIPNAYTNGCFAAQVTSRKCVALYDNF